MTSRPFWKFPFMSKLLESSRFPPMPFSRRSSNNQLVDRVGARATDSRKIPVSKNPRCSKTPNNQVTCYLCWLQTSNASFTDTHLTLAFQLLLKETLLTHLVNQKSRHSQCLWVPLGNAYAWCFMIISWKSFRWAGKTTGQWSCKTLLILDSNIQKLIKYLHYLET